MTTPMINLAATQSIDEALERLDALDMRLDLPSVLKQREQVGKARVLLRKAKETSDLADRQFFLSSAQQHIVVFIGSSKVAGGDRWYGTDALPLVAMARAFTLAQMYEINAEAA